MLWTVTKTVETEMSVFFFRFLEMLQQKKQQYSILSGPIVRQQSQDSGVQGRRTLSLRTARITQQDYLRKQTHNTHKMRKELESLI